MGERCYDCRSPIFMKIFCWNILKDPFYILYDYFRAFSFCISTESIAFKWIDVMPQREENLLPAGIGSGALQNKNLCSKINQREN